MIAKHSIYNTIIFTVALLSSCIKEDLSECKEELLLSFSYTLNNENKELFEDNIDRVEVYIFDQSGKFAGKFEESSDQLDNDYIMRIPIAKGIYSAVVYGGDLSSYSVGVLDSLSNKLDQELVSGKSSIDNLHIELNTTTGEDGYLYPQDSINDLYVGAVDGAISMSGNRYVTDVDLIKDCNDIEVNMVGAAEINDRLDLHIVASNGRYTSDNLTETSHGVLKHTPLKSIIKDDTVSSTLKMMRLMASTATRTTLTGSDSHQLIIADKQSGDTLYNKNMVDQILSTEGYNTQEDLDRDDSYTFEIALTKNGYITISVNGWIVNIITPASR